jgi:hypothetical protein
MILLHKGDRMEQDITKILNSISWQLKRIGDELEKMSGTYYQKEIRQLEEMLNPERENSIFESIKEKRNGQY